MFVDLKLEFGYPIFDGEGEILGKATFKVDGKKKGGDLMA